MDPLDRECPVCGQPPDEPCVPVSPGFAGHVLVGTHLGR